MCHQYWPEHQGEAKIYGSVSVTHTEQEIQGDYIIRHLEVWQEPPAGSNLTAKNTVTQIQYTNWPEDGVPQSTTGVLEVANLVQKVQMSTGNKAIMVMCK